MRVVRTKRKYDIVLDFKIVRICKVFDLEESALPFSRHPVSKVYILVLLINNDNHRSPAPGHSPMMASIFE